MSSWIKSWAIPQDFRVLSFGIIYPALSVICIVILARTIRRRRQSRFILPQRHMESSLSKLEEHGDDKLAQEMGPTTPRSGSSPRVSPFPTACDILQPLSHLTPLPPSGYLASLLGGPTGTQAEASEKDSIVIYDYQDIHQDDDQPTTSDTNDSRFGPFAENQSPARVQQQQHEAAVVPATWSTDNQGGEVFELPDSDRPQSIQRRSQIVHFPQVVDPEGARTWKRLVVEYN